MEKYYAKNWKNEETYNIAYKIATNEDYRHKFQKMILTIKMKTLKTKGLAKIIMTTSQKVIFKIKKYKKKQN